VFAFVDWRLGAAPDVLAHPPIDFVLRLVALGHRVLAVCVNPGALARAAQVLRIAPSSVQGPSPEPTGLAPKRRPKPRVAQHRAGPSGPRSGRFLRRKPGPVKPQAAGGAAPHRAIAEAGRLAMPKRASITAGAVPEVKIACVVPFPVTAATSSSR